MRKVRAKGKQQFGDCGGWLRRVDYVANHGDTRRAYCCQRRNILRAHAPQRVQRQCARCGHCRESLYSKRRSFVGRNEHGRKSGVVGAGSLRGQYAREVVARCADHARWSQKIARLEHAQTTLRQVDTIGVAQHRNVDTIADEQVGAAIASGGTELDSARR